MVKVLRSFVRGPLEPHVVGVRRGAAAAGLFTEFGRAARVLHRASGSLDERRAASGWTS